MQEILHSKDTIIDAGIILQKIYDFEYNIRIENHLQSGFYGSLIQNGGSLWPRGLMDLNKAAKVNVLCETNEGQLNRVAELPVIDWSERLNSDSIDSLAYMLLERLEEDRELLNVILDELVVKKTKGNVSANLSTVHKLGFCFRIQSVWDLGFDVWLIDNSVKPSRIEVDNENWLIAQQINATGKQTDLNTFKSPPDIDWTETFSSHDLEDISDWLVMKTR